MFVDEDVRIPLDDITLEAYLALPTRASGVVVFAGGSDSGQQNPQNRYVAHALRHARHALTRVQAPTLFLVGDDDIPVIEANREAMEFMKATQHPEIVSGARNRFSELIALDEVARLASEWFARNLGTAPAAPQTT